MAHDTLNLKTCYHWAILASVCRWLSRISIMGRCCGGVFFSPFLSFIFVSWRSLRRSAPEIGTLDRLAGRKTISTRINVSYDKTNSQARGDSLNHPTSRVLINNNGDNLWVAGPAPCLGNCCSSTSGWRQHMAGKENNVPLVGTDFH